MANDEESNTGISLDHLNVNGTGTRSNGTNASPVSPRAPAAPASPTSPQHPQQPQNLPVNITNGRNGPNGHADGVTSQLLRAPSVQSRSPSFRDKFRNRTDLFHLPIISGHDGNGGIKGHIRRFTGAADSERAHTVYKDIDAARMEFFHLILILDRHDDSFLKLEHYKWYYKFLECRFARGWGILRGSLRDLHEDVPDPGEFAVVYKALGIAAELLMFKESCALSDILDALMHPPHNMLRDQMNEEREVPNQMAFAMLGWLTMLFEADLRPPRQCLSIQRLDENVAGRRSRTRTLGLYTQDFSRVDQQLYLLLSHFGSLVPELRVEAARETELITVSNVCFAMLHSLAAVQIEWVNALSLHLEFDHVRRRLKVFRFPSFCRLMCHDGRVISQLFADHRGAFAREHLLDLNSPVQPEDYFREVLLSYRLLFGQDKKSWKALVEKSASWPSGWNCSSPDLDDADQLLQTLCGTSASSPAAAALYKEIEAEELSPYYYPDSFPFLGRRILDLQTFIKGRHPHNWRALWNDRRNVAYWWTFWAVLFIGGGTILLGLLQLAISIWQGISSQQQVVGASKGG